MLLTLKDCPSLYIVYITSLWLILLAITVLLEQLKLNCIPSNTSGGFMVNTGSENSSVRAEKETVT